MSNSRELILSKIRTLGSEVKELPEIPDFEVAEDLVAAFTVSINANKGEIIDQEKLTSLLGSGTYPKIYTKVPGWENFSNVPSPLDPHDFSDLNMAIIKGQFAVAENGAIWMEEQDLGFRILPFITEHLIIVLERSSLLGNMHQAYKKIGSAHSGFGLFAAGPSKTADIEQSLVIGAHGAKSLKVVLV